MWLLLSDTPCHLFFNMKIQLKKNQLQTKSLLLITATIVGNVFNFLYNAYLGRSIGLDDFAFISFLGNIMSISDIPIYSLNKTVVFKSAYLLGKFNIPAKEFLDHIKKRVFIVSLVVAGFWVLIIPLISRFFHIEGTLPLLTFTPVWIFTIMTAVYSGYISGNLKFGLIAIATVAEAVSKFLFAYLLIKFGLSEYVYLAIPLSSLVAFCTIIVSARTITTNTSGKKRIISLTFPKKFYISSVLTRISNVSYLSADVLLAKHFLSGKEAGEYALLALTGKMVYFAGSVFSQFIIPLVSHREGAGKKSEGMFYQILFATGIACLFSFMLIGFFGEFTAPILFGEKAKTILPYIFWYTLSMAAFAVSSNIVNLHQIKGKGITPVVSFILAVIQVVGISIFSSSVSSISSVMVALGFLSLVLVLFAHIYEHHISNILGNLNDFFELFLPDRNERKTRGVKILVFNWRDTKHRWAGGAETYVHELSKRWKKQGNSVTLFCGNDRKNPRNQTINGVKIIRRGGFYTVYIWALLYYVFKFRKNYDIIIDSENGIPFFTPLFSTKPVILLIHHVHQEIFIEYMKFPFSYIGKFIEGKIMPLVYKNHTVITVSQSSRDEIVNCGIAKEKNIHVINPGVHVQRHRKIKTKNPTFVYLGRLKPYKNIDTAIKAFSLVNKKIKNSQLFIVGDGESRKDLETLAEKLHIKNSVVFFGKVSEKEKVKILAKSWIALQPSTVEGWGITVIEANMCGTPVLATNTNGLRDSISNGKTGMLFKLRNSHDLAKLMLYLSKNRKIRKTMSQHAILWSKQYDWDTSSIRFLSVIQNEIANKKSFLPVRTLSYVFNRVESIF